MNTNNDAFAAALTEIEEGRLDKGAWARAFAESGGDESKAKALYIKARAEAINNLPAWHDTQPPAVDASIGSDEPVNGKDSPASQPIGLYEAALGEKNLGYYLAMFQAFDEKGPGLHASWNWASFFFTIPWALYRKMYVWFFAWWAVATVATIFGKVSELQQGVGILVLILWAGFSVFANSLYHGKIKARIAVAQKSTADASQVNRRLSSSAGVNTWVAYIFGAIPVLGIVLAIALPAYQDYSKRQAVAAAPVQAPVPPETPGNFWENDKIVTPASQVDWDKGVITPAAARTQIDDFLDGKPNTVKSERGPWEQWATTAQPVPSAQGAATNPGVQYSPPPPSKADIAAAKNYEMQERAKASKEVADLEEVSARAVREFPYLDTPEGQPVLEKIVARRNELIREGTSPALALTRAVNQYAAAYAPQPPEKRAAEVVPVKPPQNQGTDASGCRWITPQQWSCN